MVHADVPREDLPTKAPICAGAIAANAHLAVAHAKECVLRGERGPLEEGLRIKKDLNMFMDTAEDYADGAKAILPGTSSACLQGTIS